MLCSENPLLTRVHADWVPSSSDGWVIIDVMEPKQNENFPKRNTTLSWRKHFAKDPYYNNLEPWLSFTLQIE